MSYAKQYSLARKIEEDKSIAMLVKEANERGILDFMVKVASHNDRFNAFTFTPEDHGMQRQETETAKEVSDDLQTGIQDS